MHAFKALLSIFGFPVSNSSISTPMDSTLTTQTRIHKIRLFYSGSTQVALYGSPSTLDDGWIANLPAAEVFAGDVSGLLFEVLIDAQEAHQRVGFHSEIYERHIKQDPQPRLPNPFTTSEVSQSTVFVNQALQQFKGARLLASRLAQQARTDERPDEQQRWLATAAALSINAADLQSDEGL